MKVLTKAAMTLSLAGAFISIPAAGQEMAGLHAQVRAVLLGRIKPREQGRWAPLDECSQRPGARAYREKLAGAVLARDADALLELVGDEVLLDFGGGSGKEELRSRLTDSYYELWTALDNLLPLGCASDDRDTLIMPWYFAQDIPGDAFSLAIVRGQGVALRSGPKADSGVLTRLSWDAVEVEEWLEDRNAPHKVTTRKGRQGYIRGDYLRSLVDYRLVINRNEAGEWKMTAFVAGD